MAFMTGDDSPVIWRGPMLHGVIQQFFREVAVAGHRLPGGGHAAAPATWRSAEPERPGGGSVVVTTADRSVADTRRAVRMYQKLNVPTLGLIENMSHFVCPTCRHESDIFGKGGGEMLATSSASVPRSSADLRADPDWRRQRSADRHWRARLARGEGLPRRGRAAGRPVVDCGLHEETLPLTPVSDAVPRPRARGGMASPRTHHRS